MAKTYLQSTPSSTDFLDVMWHLSNKTKYAKWFVKLISNILSRGFRSKADAKAALGYVEGHHILPVSFDKSCSKVKSNIVFCTAREHFIIHLLMTKMFPNKRLSSLSKSAVLGFTMKNSTQDRKINSKTFEILRRYASERSRGNTSGSKTKGYRFYTNGSDCTTLPCGVEPPPGYYLGGLSKGLISITDGKTCRRIKPGEVIPDGWSIGNGRAGYSSKLKGRPRPPVKDKEGMINKIREKAQQKMWITDGILSKRLIIGDPIPEGWRRGRASGCKFPRVSCIHCRKVIDLGNFKKHSCER